MARGDKRLANARSRAQIPGMRKATARAQPRIELGQYIVADPAICHGQPTFKGTRIMVWQVLDDVADGRSWDFICNVRWSGKVPLAAVAEAVKLAETAWLGPDAPKGRRSSAPVLA